MAHGQEQEQKEDKDGERGALGDGEPIRVAAGPHGGCYSSGVKAVLGWLVRNGCRLERLDNHWETGVGASGVAEHIATQPLHWNAIHALLNVPNATAGLPPHAPQVWMRLHMHTGGYRARSSASSAPTSREASGARQNPCHTHPVLHLFHE